MLSHEKLDVYGVSLKFFALTSEVLEALPRGNGNLKDQLDRAATSVLLNIAEGAGKSKRKDKSNFYTISRGSAFECSAIYDALHVRHLLGSAECERGKRLLERIVSMLTNMIDFEQP